MCAGLRQAPIRVGEALKGGQLVAAVMQRAGYRVVPTESATARPSFITAVELGSEAAMAAFCAAVQAASPVGSYIRPEAGAWPVHSAVQAIVLVVEGGVVLSALAAAGAGCVCERGIHRDVCCAIGTVAFRLRCCRARKQGSSRGRRTDLRRHMLSCSHDPVACVRSAFLQASVVIIIVRQLRKPHECLLAEQHVAWGAGVTPGYGDAVIFADGTFIDGSTSELSADGPIRPPYVVYCQGVTHWTQWALVLRAALPALAAAGNGAASNTS